MNADYYFTIDLPGSAEYKDRGSKFLGYAFPVNDVLGFKERIGEIKKEHPKATHHCFAYRIGMDGNNFRVNDDGEPSGSAGKPILGQIDSKGLTNVCIIVVRYFGGTQLGIPGLINAYKTTASLALQVTPLVQRAILLPYSIQFDYTQMNEVMRIMKQFDCQIIKQENQLFCLTEIGVPRQWEKDIVYKLEQLRGVEWKKL